MKQKLEFTVFGSPFGKERPRLSRYGTYTPKKTVDYEKKVQTGFTVAYPRWKPFEDEAIKVSIIACYDVPKSYSKRRAEDCLNEIERPTKKPDTDNIAKIILDSLNGIAYRDDSQVIALRVIKVYASVARVEVIIESL